MSGFFWPATGKHYCIIMPDKLKEVVGDAVGGGASLYQYKTGPGGGTCTSHNRHIVGTGFEIRAPTSVAVLKVL